VVLIAGLLGLSCAAPADEGGALRVQQGGEDPIADAKLDPLLKSLLDRGVDPTRVTKAVPGRLLRVHAGQFDGRPDTFVDVLVQADPRGLGAIRALGATVRTVTSEGILSASVPISRVRQIAALDDVVRIEAAKAVRLYNDLSNDLFTTPAGTSAGMHNGRATGGAGIVVGVLDTGIDWTHKDFIADATESTGPLQTRVRYYWDQADTADDKPPADLGLAYGHEYVAAELDVALNDYDNTWDPIANTFGPVDTPYPIKASARDVDGHGTHVAGTSAGDGSGSGFAGGAPEADLVIVKFDFDGDRNTEAAILDGVNYIFARAAQLGKPAVINMSLGTDYGPHDGSTLEERGIDALTGPGKVVAVAAGNPGANNWSQALTWGYALHGKATMPAEKTTFRFPTYSAGADNYAFFDVWYPGGNKCRVRVTTPAAKVYPPSSKAYAKTWVTGSAYTGFNTTEGAILVGNGGDQLGWGSNGASQEAYIELSDYFGTPPAIGTWTFELVPADARSVCSGTYHVWYGASDNVYKGWRDEPVRNPTPRFAGRESDNEVTVGSPSTANKVLSVAAYMTRMSWLYAWGTECTDASTTPQAYNAGQLAYYDAYDVGELAYFSGRGPRRDNVLKPEIATPGVGIASAFSHFVRQVEWPDKCASYSAGGPYHYGTNRVLPGSEATILQGTSMATPNATGAIALLLQQKHDADAACLRNVFATTARHDAATDVYAKAPSSAFTDTDTGAGAGLPNADWGYGKLDIVAGAGALAAYVPSCKDAGACKLDADCAAGTFCEQPTDPCACGTCQATPTCKATGAACGTGSDCCSGVCSGKGKAKVCK